jgi:cytochrome P450
VYRKPGVGRRMLTQLVGSGVIVAEGDAHRMQRKALNPAFGAAQIRELTGVFLDKANEVRAAPPTLLSVY